MSIEATQIHLAVSTPKATGSDCRPSARSPCARRARGGGGRGEAGGGARRAGRQGRAGGPVWRSVPSPLLCIVAAGVRAPRSTWSRRRHNAQLLQPLPNEGSPVPTPPRGPARLDRLEVVDDGDAEAGDGVEHRQHHHVQGQRAEERLRGPCRGKRGGPRQEASRHAAGRCPKQPPPGPAPAAGQRCAVGGRLAAPPAPHTWPAHQGNAM